MDLITRIPKMEEWVTEYKEKIKLTNKDKKIIIELLKNSKIPLSKLSKKLGMNRDTIKYRIEKMMRSGLIQGFSALIDYTKIGYTSYILLVSLRNLHKSFEEELKEFFIRTPEILKVHKLSGKWTLHIDLIAKNSTKLDELLTKLKNFCSGYVDDYEILEVLEEYKYAHIPVGAVAEGISFEMPAGHATLNEKVEVDEKDLSILKLLTKNARLPTAKISQKVGLSIDATHNRIKKLMKKRIIKGYYLVANSAVLGLDTNFVYIQLTNTTKTGEKEFLNYVEKHPFINLVTKTGFKWNYYIQISSWNPEHFDKILMELKTKFSGIIKDYESMIEVGEYKFTEFPEEVKI